MRHATSIRTLQVHNRNDHKVYAHVTHSVQCSSVQHKQCSAACSVLCNVWQCGAVQHAIHPNTPIATMLLQRNHATYATINAKPTAPQPQHRPYSAKCSKPCNTTQVRCSAKQVRCVSPHASMQPLPLQSLCAPRPCMHQASTLQCGCSLLCKVQYTCKRMQCICCAHAMLYDMKVRCKLTKPTQT